MQRILQPGEIEALDHNSIPRVRIAQRLDVFGPRAQRLRQLASNHPIGDYLRLMADLCDAQQHALGTFQAPAPAPERLARAQAHSMPLLNAADWPRDGAWQQALRQIIARLDSRTPQPVQLAELLVRVRAQDAAQLDAQADALLNGRPSEVDPAAAPFIMAALQVYWLDMVARLTARQVPMLDTPGVCPCCGSAPVASIVRIGGEVQGYRYLHCSLCATEWHMVRVKCSHCDSTKGIAYHGIEGGSEAVKAETCDACHTYRKICYQDKDPLVEPLADDLASLMLDLLLSEENYVRSSGNPLLWQEAQG